MAYAIAGLFLYTAVIALHFMGLEIFGRGYFATLASFPTILTDVGFWPLAVLFAAFVMVLPPVKLLVLTVVLIGLRRQHPPAMLRRLFRWYALLGPWAMVEVFLVGIFVAYTRLIGLATVNIGAAAWSLGGLMAAMIAADATVDRDAIWAAIDQRCAPLRSTSSPLTQGRGIAQSGTEAPPAPRSVTVTSPMCKPDAAGLAGCQSCGQVVCLTHMLNCPRCGVHIWRRKPASLSRTWALLISASICAVGAYAYPIMTVTRLGHGEPTTITAGIIELFAIGWWPIGIIVFVASLTIPLFKLIALGAMLIGTQRGSTRGLRTRTRIYRFVEAIGRWSMIDIFMISILTGLVQFGFLGEIHPNEGAIAFAAVVILTMLAAYSFDPRLMWDAAAGRRAEKKPSRA